MAEAFFAVNLREEGVLLVRGRFCYPREDAFCAELATRAEVWLRETLLPYAKRLYSEDTTPKTRFLFARFEYSFAIAQTDEDLRVCVSLSRDNASLARYERRFAREQDRFIPKKIK